MIGMTVSALEEEREALASTLLDAMAEGADTAWSDERFNAIALRVFRYQASANPAYGALIRHRAINPSQLTDWRDAPCVPTRAFRELPLACTAPSPPEAIFRTSGTTTAGQTRGEHRVRDLSLYRASLLPTARRFLRPELDACPAVGQSTDGRQASATPCSDRAEPTLRVLSLTPPPGVLPDSSLVFMLGTLADAWDDGGGGFFARSDWSLDVDALRQAVGRAHEEDQAVMIAGTAFAFVHWVDAIRSSELPSLPWGSRALETGGYKGRSREVPREELHRAIAAVHGIGPGRIINEYGMTELLSQFYEPVLLEGDPAQEESPGLRGPPWIRTRILDPVSLRRVRPGDVGLLAHFDLANLDSISAVLTEDLGFEVRKGFRVLGRVPGSEPRGCSLAMEDLIEAQRHGL